MGGLAAAPAGHSLGWVLAGTAAACGVLTLGARAAVVAAALVLAATGAGSARLAAIDRPARAAPPGTAIDGRATLLERPRPTRFGAQAVVRLDTGPARGLRALARADWADWPLGARPGLRVRLRGFVRGERVDGGRAPSDTTAAGSPGTPGRGPLPRRAPPGGEFDFAAFLRSRGIGRELSVEWMRPVGRRGGVAGVVDGIRARAESAIGAGLSRERAAVARGMVLGQDGDVPEEVRDDFRRAGLAHLLAASGQNVMLLCALALPLLVLTGARPRSRVVVLLALVALYVPLAGAGASVQRAGIMAGAGLIALAAGRPASAWYALLLAAAVTLGLNPRASGDPGWQLSFAAVAGMLVLRPPLRAALRGLPRLVAEAMAATVAATVATAPLMAHQFGAVSLAALPANVVALPAVAPVMWIGMTQAGLAQAALLGHVPAEAAGAAIRGAGKITGVALGWVAGSARRFAEPGWAQAPLTASWTVVAAGYAAIAAVALGARPAAGRLCALARARAPGDAVDAWRAMPTRTRRAVPVAVVGVAALALGVPGGAPAPPARLTVDYLDVGQGDATLVRDPSGAAVLFDGGPPEARVERTLRRLGVRRLSVVVATHHSRDHHAGLLAVVRRFPVDLFLDGGDGTADPSFAALQREVDRRGIRRVAARRGQVLTAGSLTVRILWPPPRPPGPAAADPNPRATVAIVSSGGFDLFLSADAESTPLLSLALPRVEAMKVPHHGSADPGLPELLSRLRPRIAAIEVGRGNEYGHPHPATLDALRARVPHVYRTDRDGTVELQVEDGQAVVRTHR